MSLLTSRIRRQPRVRNIHRFGTSPAVSGNKVAFDGVYTNVEGVFAGSGGALTTIAKFGDASALRNLRCLQQSRISGGSVVFNGYYTSFSQDAV